MVETVIGPIAPPCCMCAISTVLCVFACGRKATPDWRALSRMRMQLRSRMERSTRNAGVVSANMKFEVRGANEERRSTLSFVIRTSNFELLLHAKDHPHRHGRILRI